MIELKETYFYDLELLLKFRLDIIYSNEKIDEDKKSEIADREKESIAEHIKDCKFITKDKIIIGYIVFYENNNSNMLREIYLLEEYRNKKIGSNIIKRLTRKHNSISLYVYKNNEQQIKFFERLKFTISKEKNNKFLMIYSN